MEPHYLDGDLVLVAAVDVASLEPGDVIVVRHPFKNVDVIKYVDSIDPDGYLVLQSPSGDDSHQFGRVATQTVRGRVGTNLSRLRRRR